MKTPDRRFTHSLCFSDAEWETLGYHAAEWGFKSISDFIRFMDRKICGEFDVPNRVAPLRWDVDASPRGRMDREDFQSD